MTGMAIWENIQFEIYLTARLKGGTIPRSRMEYYPTQGIAIIDLLYEFRATIGTGNNEGLYRHGQ